MVGAVSADNGISKLKDFEISDSDMSVGEENGMPTIEFSARIHRLLVVFGNDYHCQIVG